MKLRSFATLGSLVVGGFVVNSFAACSSSPTNVVNTSDGGSSSGGGNGSSSGGNGSGSSGGSGSSSGSGNGSSGTGGSSGSSSGTHPGSSSGGSSGGSSSGSGSSSGAGSSSGGSSGGFPAGTICNSTGTPLTPPATLKNIIVILMENENFSSVNGSGSAPYISSLATKCGVATKYYDSCFTTVDEVSLPHYLALTSGSNCNTGNESTGTGCIEDDNDVSSHALSTTSIFSQVTSWKAYQEGMPSACDPSSSGNYATKHNPPPYYTSLTACSSGDIAIPAITCTGTANTPCSAPTGPFVDDLNNDTLAQFTFVTPNLINDMHGTVLPTITQGDNWLATYMPLILASKAYLRGDVAVNVIWDEAGTFSATAPTPNVFVSPYITAGTTSATPMNHYSLLRTWEKAFGISTYLGCASGTAPGGVGTCAAESTADVRAALGW